MIPGEIFDENLCALSILGEIFDEKMKSLSIPGEIFDENLKSFPKFLIKYGEKIQYYEDYNKRTINSSKNI